MPVSDFITTSGKRIKLPIFFPDATMGVVRMVDSTDLQKAKIKGVLVNSYHIYRTLGKNFEKKKMSISDFMSWDGAVISDSGGFQIMSLAKNNDENVKIDSKGVVFKHKNKTIRFTPKRSVKYQLGLGTDLVVVLDDIGRSDDTRSVAKQRVERTIKWAKESKYYFERYLKRYDHKKRPYLIAVVQGGKYKDLRKHCKDALIEIGFDGLGYGGILEKNNKSYEIAKLIADGVSKDTLLYGLGIGKPEDIVEFYKLGYKVFDCVIPTREARHGSLYIYEAKNLGEIDLNKKIFYKTYKANKLSKIKLDEPISEYCDCLLCENYSKAYLAHLFSLGDPVALRLSTIHNLRFYSILMETLRNKDL